MTDSELLPWLTMNYYHDWQWVTIMTDSDRLTSNDWQLLSYYDDLQWLTYYNDWQWLTYYQCGQCL